MRKKFAFRFINSTEYYVISLIMIIMEINANVIIPDTINIIGTLNCRHVL